MSGEADEDTMSAWGSLNSGLGSPAELGNGPTQSLRRRNSFGMQMSPFSEEPGGSILPPDRQKDHVFAGAELSENGGDGRRRNSMVNVVQHAMDAGLVDQSGGEAREVEPVATLIDGAVDKDKDLEGIHDKTAAAVTSATVGDDVPDGGIDEPSLSPSAAVLATAHSTGPSGGDEEVAPIETPQETLLDGSGTRVIGDFDPRRRSNQDDSDQSNGSARSGSSITGVRVPGEEAEQRLGQGVGSELPPPAFSLSGSVDVDSVVSDARCVCMECAVTHTTPTSNPWYLLLVSLSFWPEGIRFHADKPYESVAGADDVVVNVAAQ